MSHTCSLLFSKMNVHPNEHRTLPSWNVPVLQLKSPCATWPSSLGQRAPVQRTQGRRRLGEKAAFKAQLLQPLLAP